MERTIELEGGPIPYAAWARQLVMQHPPDLFVGGLAIPLDYSPASVAAIDATIDAIYGCEGAAPAAPAWTPSKVQEAVVLRYGAYIGQVVAFTFDGRWRNHPEHETNPLWAQVVFPGGTFMPMTQVYRRLKNGVAEAIFPQVRSLARNQRRLLAGWAPGFLQLAEKAAAEGQLPLDERVEFCKHFCRLAGELDPTRMQQALMAEVCVRALAAASETTREPAAIPAPAPVPATPAPPSQETLKRRNDLLDRATDLLLAHDNDGALPFAQQALDLLPRDPAALRITALILTRLGRHLEALPHALLVSELDPGDINSWQVLGAVQASLKDYKAAAVVWQRVTAMQPAEPQPWMDRAWICNLAGFYGDAMDCLTRYLELRPADPMGLLMKLVIADRFNDRTQAGVLAMMVLGNPDHVKELWRKPPSAYRYLMTPEMSPKLRALFETTFSEE